MATTTPDIATSTPPVSLTCTMAYTSDLYDTATGHAATGATVIGTQSWTDCNDGHGNTYEFKLTREEYAALATPNAPMPRKSTAESYHPVPSNSDLTVTDSTATTTDVTTTVTTPNDAPTTDLTSATTTAENPPSVEETSTTTPVLPADTDTMTSSTTPDSNSSSTESTATVSGTTKEQ